MLREGILFFIYTYLHINGLHCIYSHGLTTDLIVVIFFLFFLPNEMGKGGGGDLERLFAGLFNIIL